MQSTCFGAVLILELCCFCCCCSCCCLNFVWVGCSSSNSSGASHRSPGVSIGSISQYLLVFYYKLFYTSALNKQYITYITLRPIQWDIIKIVVLKMHSPFVLGMFVTFFSFYRHAKCVAKIWKSFGKNFFDTSDAIFGQFFVLLTLI